ncbi:hypothetical protein Vretimale_14053, partial [Volvox reticuliferus]
MNLADIAALKKQAADAFGDGDLHLCISKTMQAIDLLSKAIRDAPTVQRGAMMRELSCLHSNLAAALLELGNYPSSAEEARTAIELDPSWHRPYLRLCIALTAMHGTSTEAAAAALCRGLENCQDPRQLRELQDALSTLHCATGNSMAHAGKRRTADPSAAFGKRGPPGRWDKDPHSAIAKYQRCDIPDPDGSTQPTEWSKDTRAATSALAIPQQAINRNEGIDTDTTTTPGQLAAGAAVPSLSPSSPSEAAAGSGSQMQQQQQQQVYSDRTQGQQRDQTQHHNRLPRLLPVTALCGFLGSGKTTLVRHLLSSLESSAVTRVGLLVNDLAALNIDARLIMPPPVSLTATAGAAAAAPRAATDTDTGVGAAVCFPHTSAVEELLEFSNGCICCNLREEMQQQLRQLAARQPPLEHLIVECTGVGEPAPLAAAIRALAAEGLELRSVVTVVDVAEFLDAVSGTEDRRCREQRGGGGRGGDGSGGGVTQEISGQHLEGIGTEGRRPVQDKSRDDDNGDGGGDGSEGYGKLRILKPPQLRPPLPPRDADAAMSVAVAEAEVIAGSGCDRSTPRRPLAQLLVQQIETADIVVLNKCDRLLEHAQQHLKQSQKQAQQQGQQQGTVAADITTLGSGEIPLGEDLQPAAVAAASGLSEMLELIARRELRRALGIVRALNPSARVLTAVRCAVPWEMVMRLRPLQRPPPSVAQAQSQSLRVLPLPPGPLSPVGGTVVAMGTVDIDEVHLPVPMTEAAAEEEVGDKPGASHAARLTALKMPQPQPQPQPRPPSALALNSDAMPIPVSMEPTLEQQAATATVADAGNGQRRSTGRALEEDEYGIGSFVFRSRVPFHPARLWALLQAIASADTTRGGDGGKATDVVEEGMVMTNELVGEGGAGQKVVLPYQPPPLLRAKGFFWIASLDQAIWELSLAGGQVEAEAVGRWLCTMVNQEHWPVGHSHPRNTRTAPAATTGAVNGMALDTEAAAKDEVEVRVTGTAKPDGGPHSDDGGDGWDGTDREEGGNDSGDEEDYIGEFVSVGERAGGQRWHRRWGDRRNELVFIG